MLRIANKDDKEQLKPMCMAFLNSSPYKDFDVDEGFVDFLIDVFTSGDPKSMAVVWDEDSTIKGFVAFELGTWLYDPTAKVAIERVLWVNPGDRMAKIATELMEAYEAWGKEVGAVINQLSSVHGPFAEVLDEFYTKHGYTKVEYTYLKKVKE